MLELLGKYEKQIGYVILGILVVYGFIWISTRQPQIPADLKTTIDSLTKVNQQLLKHQQQIDNTIDSISDNVGEVDSKISNIKEKTTIIREYYHEQASAASKYTPTQIDSFFKARYHF